MPFAPAQPGSVTTISVVVPTLDRPSALRRALASVSAQVLPADLRVELLVVDNSRDGNARQIVQATEGSAALTVRYLSAIEPGVATARNVGVAAATGDWVAFLDDDEEASRSWLATMLAVARDTGADATFGPVRARAEHGGSIEPFGRYFSRSFNLPRGAFINRLAAYLGTNNSMFARTACLAAGPPFDTSLDQIGGEDSLLLRTLVAGGRRFVWAPDAEVTEWVPPKRLSWRYVRRRKFLSGQIRTFVHRMVRPARWWAVGFWMGAGAAQFTLTGFGALLCYGIDRGRARQLYASACGGLGKVFWTPRFRPNLYGRGLVS